MAKHVKVRLLCNRTSGDTQQSYGEEVPMSPAEARRHIADGIGELVKGQTLPDEDDIAVRAASGNELSRNTEPDDDGTNEAKQSAAGDAARAASGNADAGTAPAAKPKKPRKR